MSDADPQPGTDGGSTATTAERVRRGLDYALLGGLVLLGFVAAVQFYFAADRTINVWVTREYRPPFKMVFNLVVLLVVGVGVSRQVRRLTASDTDDDPDSTPDATTDGGHGSTTATTVDDDPDSTTGESETIAGEGVDRTDDSAGPPSDARS